VIKLGPKISLKDMLISAIVFFLILYYFIKYISISWWSR